jgi:hypothetical protein
MKRKGIKSPFKTNFFVSVGYLASNERQTKLDAELHKRAQSRFESKYRDITGVTPKPDDRNYYLLHSDADKWGVELRISFISNDNIPLYLKDSVVDPRPGGEYNSRINDNDFIWQLIEYGFRLSNEQDTNLIASYIPEGYEDDFQKGLEL